MSDLFGPRGMTPDQAKRILAGELPGLKITSVVREGQGLDYFAFRVNRKFVFRFPQHRQQVLRMKSEAAALALARRVTSFRIPEPAFFGARAPFVGYARIEGIPLLHCWERLSKATLRRLARRLGKFIRELQQVSPQGALTAGVKKDSTSIRKQRSDVRRGWKRIRHLVPAKYHLRIKEFFSSSLPAEPTALTFCHHDLGIEHILVRPGSWRITGIIDWGDASVADVAGDLGRVCRDLGPDALDSILEEFSGSGAELAALRERAMFLARCSLFEDLIFAERFGYPAYRRKGLKALPRMFG